MSKVSFEEFFALLVKFGAAVDEPVSSLRSTPCHQIAILCTLLAVNAGGRGGIGPRGRKGADVHLDQ